MASMNRRSWYETCDEETVRPWTGALPADAQTTGLLLAAEIRLHDGTIYPGACYHVPSALRASALMALEGPMEAKTVSDLQPRLFLGNRTVRFWEGVLGDARDREFFFRTVARELISIFPITFVVKDELIEGGLVGQVPGFCRLNKKEQILVEQAIYLPREYQEEDSTSEPINPFALEPIIYKIEDLEEAGKLNDALELANKLVADNPTDPRSWKTRSEIYASYRNITAALEDAIQAAHCAPEEISLYYRICQFLLASGDYQGCLDYADTGLRARNGDWRTRNMYQEELTFIGARALYELGQHQLALDRLAVFALDREFGRHGNVLMSVRGLTKACKAAMRKSK